MHRKIIPDLQISGIISTLTTNIFNVYTNQASIIRTTQYHYDTQGHLIGENTTNDTRFTREYIWLGDMPVALMQ